MVKEHSNGIMLQLGFLYPNLKREKNIEKGEIDETVHQHGLVWEREDSISRLQKKLLETDDTEIY